MSQLPEIRYLMLIFHAELAVESHGIMCTSMRGILWYGLYLLDLLGLPWILVLCSFYTLLAYLAKFKTPYSLCGI